MSLLAIVLVGLPLLLAYANGSNDISKGIATLVGSGVSNFRVAVFWGTGWTVLGGFVAAFASQGLVATFSGKGFLAAPIGGTGFPGAVAIGAIAWILFASRAGLPVSTTHAITGALAGAGIVAQGAAALHWNTLAWKVGVPLALSPLLSIVILSATYPRFRRVLARADDYCVCLERRAVIRTVEAGGAGIGAGAILAPAGSGRGEHFAGAMATGALATMPPQPVLGLSADCAISPAMAGRVGVLDALHWISSALTSFARGLNDTPKIVALGVVASALVGMNGVPMYVVIAVAMGAGSLIAGFRVTETLARKVTPMTPGEGFSANLVTTLLVGAASFWALPVSTTHVSSGAIIGLGLQHGTGSVRWRTVGNMLLAWLVTLPTAALVGACAYALLR